MDDDDEDDDEDDSNQPQFQTIPCLESEIYPIYSLNHQVV